MSYRERYYKLKSKLAKKVRRKILERDNWRCQVCKSPFNLEVAHITDATLFVKYYGLEDGLKESFREDNLITLCKSCHRAYHMVQKGLYVGNKISSRAEKVYHLFAKKRYERGYWFIPKHGMKRRIRIY